MAKRTDKPLDMAAYAREIARRRWSKATPEQKAENARRAAVARWNAVRAARKLTSAADDIAK